MANLDRLKIKSSGSSPFSFQLICSEHTVSYSR